MDEKKMFASNRLMSEIMHVKQGVWKLARTTREQKPYLPEYIRKINDLMTEYGLVLTWSLIDFEFGKEDDGSYKFLGSIDYVITDVMDGDEIGATWFVSGVGDSQAEAFRNAMCGAKELFLCHYFDVPQRELDPEKIIRSEYEEREKQRAKQTKEILDQIHVQIQQTLFAKPEMRKQIDDVVMQFARVNGRPSATYYAITTLEVAQALQEAIAKLLTPDVV